MQYKLTEAGREKIDRLNVDFGGGLERITMAAQNQNNIFKTDVFWDYIVFMQEKYGVSYDDTYKNVEVIVDHCRAITFLLMDGCIPSNKDQGYYLRRLMRRVLTKLHLMDVPNTALEDLIQQVIEKLGSDYEEMLERRETILDVLRREVNAFAKNLHNGMKYYTKITHGKDHIE